MLGGCGASTASVSPPSAADPVARAACGRLHAALPASLEGLDSRPTSPKSALTAAWGDPPVVLRCGVGVPAGYHAGVQTAVVDGVQWFQRVAGDTVVWTTVDRTPRVQLRVPTSRPGQGAFLVDLAGPVARAVPAGGSSPAPSGQRSPVPRRSASASSRSTSSG